MMTTQTLAEVVQENIEYDKANVFRTNPDLFPEEAREQRARVPARDDFHLAVSSAFTLSCPLPILGDVVLSVTCGGWW
jgi:hypothetical protein